MSTPGLVVAAHKSGAGKTTVTLALLAALRRRGLAVQSAKAGPDYIDPAFHAHATGREGINLDSWSMPPGVLDALIANATRDAGVFVVEGVMGLFDGIAGDPGRTGATADLASRFRLPVLFVIDVSAQAQSAAAMLHGFATYDPAVQIAGVILNRVGSERHGRLVKGAVEALGIPILGALPRDTSIALPERHLGLVQANEHGDLAERLEALAGLAERHFNIDSILSLARAPYIAGQETSEPLPPPGGRIAIAHDAAFTFLYPHLTRSWRAQGVEFVSFSPLEDEGPDETCDACWLPGGYPELHAGALANASRFKARLAAFAATRPVHGECGGYMVLGEGLVDAAGTRHAMSGLLGHTTSFAARKLHLGYRQAELLVSCALGPRGTTIRGHEFHYASVTDSGPDAPLCELRDGEGLALGTGGARRGTITGTFFHAVAAA